MTHIYVCLCDINDVYTISEVLNNFISFTPQKMTHAHLKENKKWGRYFHHLIKPWLRF